METMIVGFGLLLTCLVVTYKPEAISDPALLERSQSVLALGSGARLYHAFERLLIGLLIHACFSAVVMLAVARSRPRLLFVAMGWHFAHNMIGFNLHRLSDHGLMTKGWIVFIILVYSPVLYRLYRRLPGHVAANGQMSPGRREAFATRSPRV